MKQGDNIFEVLYIKELDNVDELFKESSTLHRFLKYIIYMLKKIFCILTIKENGICVLPYRKVENKIIIKAIIKIIEKNTKRVVLSNYLRNIEELNMQINNCGIYIFNGDILIRYLLYSFVNYISKQTNQKTETQEVYFLVNNPSNIDENNIMYFATNFRRINIVSKNIKRFVKLENYLENELGIPITVTNNKRKSLLKAKIIINLDFNEDELNSYNINSQSIIIQCNNKVCIKSKLFNGINVLDYQIVYDNQRNGFDKEKYKKFDKKLLYESTIIGMKYGEIIDKIKEDNLKIVNLIGKNGVINWRQEVKSWRI